ncbi:uncharacterized protein FOMMEDRAFT_23155 [Fomitiporia mediterranea MF3/22]|uniref:uncharacterized protein n=1 Tax=Fomitiporia mediterranea (strain MF3/22) TaxID=694068 RepID=UPI00044091E0|nr:uncharacterized protein FOMMEDRAFT_23155 [Fomitiporia mediterranea MF3/22]EJC99271.1 hypothetical protein FOMMEDRAFT_23155 [Fomitiporia mediterranea MF3/22]
MAEHSVFDVHVPIEHTATDKESILESTTDMAAGFDGEDPNKSVSRETTSSSLGGEAPPTHAKSSQMLSSFEFF